MDASKTPGFTSVQPELYDALIDWPKRLANETAFLREVFERVGAKRVLDAACGTGRHAAMFHSWGMEVEGADASQAMIEGCRRQYGEPVGLRWLRRRFDQGPRSEETARFDVVVCVGNSLALAEDEAGVARSVHAMMDWLRPGGALIVQVLNLYALPEGHTTWQKCMRVSLHEQDHVLIKGVHRGGDRGYVDLIDLSMEGGQPSPRYDQAVFLGLVAQQLTQIVQSAGGRAVEVCGSYAKANYDAARSVDLILTGIKGG